MENLNPLDQEVTKREEFEIRDAMYRYQAARTRMPYVRQDPKIGRNEPCTCGSGKKYKHCCGK